MKLLTAILLLSCAYAQSSWYPIQPGYIYYYAEEGKPDSIAKTLRVKPIDTTWVTQMALEYCGESCADTLELCSGDEIRSQYCGRLNTNNNAARTVQMGIRGFTPSLQMYRLDDTIRFLPASVTLGSRWEYKTGDTAIIHALETKSLFGSLHNVATVKTNAEEYEVAEGLGLIKFSYNGSVYTLIGYRDSLQAYGTFLPTMKDIYNIPVGTFIQKSTYSSNYPSYSKSYFEEYEITNVDTIGDTLVFFKKGRRIDRSATPPRMTTFDSTSFSINIAPEDEDPPVLWEAILEPAQGLRVSRYEYTSEWGLAYKPISPFPIYMIYSRRCSDTSQYYRPIFKQLMFECESRWGSDPGYYKSVYVNRRGWVDYYDFGFSWSQGGSQTFICYPNGDSIGLYTDMDSLMNTLTTRELSIEQLPIHPNPTTGTITLDAPLPGKLQVFDMVGREMYARKLRQGEQRVDLTHLPNGTYYLRYANRYQQKLVILH